MSESIVERAHSYLAEGERGVAALPTYIRNANFSIVTLLRDYYDYLNSESAPSFEITNITANHDIDEASDRYLTEIAKQFARGVPESQTLDKRRLYKLVHAYYKTRGGEDSVYTFFRLFFNEFVRITYPKTQIFTTSGDQSLTSDNFKIQDGEYYQAYSYVISSENPSSEWRESYARFIHPAGLKFFVAFVVVMTNMNCWGGSPSDYLKDFDENHPDLWWDKIDWKRLRGYYNPLYQAGVGDNGLDISHILIWRYPNNRYSDIGVRMGERYEAAFLDVIIKIIMTERNHRAKTFREDYQQWLKFLDSSEILSYGNHTIEEAEEEWTGTNACRFEAFAQSPHITDMWDDAVLS